MLIRPEQEERLRAELFKDYVERMMVHLRTHFAAQVSSLTPPNLRAFVVQGISKARTYGVEDENDIRRYLECMAVYGRDYDTDPRTEWAGEILRQEGLSATVKMVHVVDRGMFAAAEGV
jgi:hypothetical protein